MPQLTEDEKRAIELGFVNLKGMGFDALMVEAIFLGSFLILFDTYHVVIRYSGLLNFLNLFTVNNIHVFWGFLMTPLSILPFLIGIQGFFILRKHLKKKGVNMPDDKKVFVWIPWTVGILSAWMFGYMFLPSTIPELVIWIAVLFIFYIHDGIESFPCFHLAKDIVEMRQLKIAADADQIKRGLAGMVWWSWVIACMAIAGFIGIYPPILFFIYYGRYLFETLLFKKAKTKDQVFMKWAKIEKRTRINFFIVSLAVGLVMGFQNVLYTLVFGEGFIFTVGGSGFWP